MGTTQGWFESDEDYRDRVAREADERTIEEMTGAAPSQGWSESDEDYRNRISREADEHSIEKTSGSAPVQGWFENDEVYRSRVAREANECRVGEVTGATPSQGWFESDEHYDTRVRKEANEGIVERYCGVPPRQGWFESDHDYRSRIAHEAREIRADGERETVGQASESVSYSSLSSCSASNSNRETHPTGCTVLVAIIIVLLLGGVLVCRDFSRTEGDARRDLAPSSRTIVVPRSQVSHNFVNAKAAQLESPKASPAVEEHYESKLVFEVQQLLAALGYTPGPIDGQYGSQTVMAISAFQNHDGTKADGRITDNLLKSLRSHAPGRSMLRKQQDSPKIEPVARHSERTATAVNALPPPIKDRETHGGVLSGEELRTKDRAIDSSQFQNTQRVELSTSKEPTIVSSDGRFTQYDNGVIADTRTGLEWVVGPTKISLHDAQSWVRNLATDGGSWRLPTLRELNGIYQKGVGITKGLSKHNRDSLFEPCGAFIWSGDEKPVRGGLNDVHVWGFSFSSGEEAWSAPDSKGALTKHGAFAVREAKRKTTH